MASLQVIKKKTGTAYRIHYYENGAARSIYIPDATKAQAVAEKQRIENALRLKEAQRAAGQYVQKFGIRKRNTITLKEFAGIYERDRTAEVKVEALAWVTLRRQLQALRLFVAMFPDRLIENLTSEDIEEFKTRRAEKISAFGVNKDLGNLKICLRWAYKKGILSTQIWDRVELFKVEKKLPEIYTTEEIDRIEQFVIPDVALFAFRIVKFSGIRRTELTRIRWQDVHEDYIALPHTKTRKQRTIPLHSKLKAVLDDWREKTKPAPAELLVPLHPDTLTHYFRRAIQHAGLYRHKNSVHVFRHSLGAYLAANGFNLNEIAQIMGHETLLMAKLYSQIPKTAIKAKLDDLYGR